MDIHTGIERYLRHHRAEGSTAMTIKGYTWFLGQFARHVGGDTALATLEADHLRAWIDALRARDLAQHSVETMVRSVKAWSRWLVAEEYLDRDPFARVKRPKVDDVAKPTFTPEEVDRLLAACKGNSRTGLRDFTMMLLMFSTGLRAGEVVNLRVDDIDWQKGMATVRRGKGGKFRVVPLGRKVERALQRYLDSKGRRPAPGVSTLFVTYYGQAMTYATLVQAVEARGKAAGVDANPHKFRHSCAITYLRNEGRIEVLRAMLGHSNLKMTLHYARIAGVDLAAAHETADPVRSLKTRV